MDWSFPHFQTGWYSCGKIGLTPKWAIHPVFHVSLIKPYLSNGSVQPPPPLDYIDDEPIFQVDCLLDQRLSKKGNRKEIQTWLNGQDTAQNIISGNHHTISWINH